MSLDKLREMYDTDDSGLAHLLGVDKATVSRYRSGAVEMPQRIEYAIDSLLRHNKQQARTIRKERIKG